MYRKPNRRFPVLDARNIYERTIGAFRAIARQHGYALATHGSLARDIDLVAVPWRAEVSTPETLIQAFCAYMNTLNLSACYITEENSTGFPPEKISPARFPHGREGWSIYLGGYPTYFDISIIPPTRE